MSAIFKIRPPRVLFLQFYSVQQCTTLVSAPSTRSVELVVESHFLISGPLGATPCHYNRLSNKDACCSSNRSFAALWKWIIFNEMLFSVWGVFQYILTMLMWVPTSILGSGLDLMSLVKIIFLIMTLFLTHSWLHTVQHHLIHNPNPLNPQPLWLTNKYDQAISEQNRNSAMWSVDRHF